MKPIKLKIITFIIVCLSGNFLGNSQVRVSEILQETMLTSKESKLYLVDFWATWCVPCHHLKKQLTHLQKQFPFDFHIISLSAENPEKVERFLIDKPTELTIAIDDYNSTNTAFDITSYPSGVLFNAKGDVLWQGHPAELKPKMIKQFLSQTKKRKTLLEFVDLIEEKTTRVKSYTPKKPIEIKNYKEDIEDVEIFNSNAYVRLRGNLSGILSDLSKTYKGQIELPAKLDKNYEVYILKPLLPETDYGLKVIEELGYAVTETTATGEVISLKLENPMFWDTYQIDWNRGEAINIVSDTEITANDTSLKELSYLISRAIDKPVVLIFDDVAVIKKAHDWKVHYKYFEFMQSNLLDYGIKVEKSNTTYPKYIVTKKAP